jgi:hypothetical protein
MSTWDGLPSRRGLGNERHGQIFTSQIHAFTLKIHAFTLQIHVIRVRARRRVTLLFDTADP